MKRRPRGPRGPFPVRLAVTWALVAAATWFSAAPVASGETDGGTVLTDVASGDDVAGALDWTIGRWHGVRRDGADGTEAPMTLRAEPILDGAGVVFHLEVRHGEPPYRGFSVQVPAADGERWLRRYTSAGRGAFAALEGRVDGARSVWTSTSTEGPRRSRLVSERLGDDRWRRTMSISEDGGDTWRVLWVDELERSG